MYNLLKEEINEILSESMQISLLSEISYGNIIGEIYKEEYNIYNEGTKLNKFKEFIKKIIKAIIDCIKGMIKSSVNFFSKMKRLVTTTLVSKLNNIKMKFGKKKNNQTDDENDFYYLANVKHFSKTVNVTQSSLFYKLYTDKNSNSVISEIEFFYEKADELKQLLDLAHQNLNNKDFNEIKSILTSEESVFNDKINNITDTLERKKLYLLNPTKFTLVIDENFPSQLGQMLTALQQTLQQYEQKDKTLLKEINDIVTEDTNKIKDDNFRYQFISPIEEKLHAEIDEKEIIPILAKYFSSMQTINKKIEICLYESKVIIGELIIEISKVIELSKELSREDEN